MCEAAHFVHMVVEMVQIDACHFALAEECSEPAGRKENRIFVEADLAEKHYYLRTDSQRRRSPGSESVREGLEKQVAALQVLEAVLQMSIGSRLQRTHSSGRHP